MGSNPDLWNTDERVQKALDNGFLGLYGIHCPRHSGVFFLVKKHLLIETLITGKCLCMVSNVNVGAQYNAGCAVFKGGISISEALNTMRIREE